MTELDHDVNKNIEDKIFNPKTHPGRLKVPCCELPAKIVKSFQTIVKGMYDVLLLF